MDWMKMNPTDEEKVAEYLARIYKHATNIRMDWTAPKEDARAIWKLVDKLSKELDVSYEEHLEELMEE